jgi:competence protein ComEA
MVVFQSPAVIDLTGDSGSLGPPMSRPEASDSGAGGRDSDVPAEPVVSENPTTAHPPETPTTVSSDGLINVNTADAALLQTLPGIGRVKARAIIDHRNANGPFRTIEQLDDVTGIGPVTMSNIRPLVTVD